MHIDIDIIMPVSCNPLFSPLASTLSWVFALRTAFSHRTGATEYDLILSADLNSPGHTQWFCFRVRKMKDSLRYRFHIINFEKPGSAFNLGMRPVMYSAKMEAATGHGWTRTGDDICYYRNFFQRPTRRGQPSDDSYYYSLSFSMSFPFTDDTVFLCYCYPFTYSFQRACLSYLTTQPDVARCMRRQPLCYTLGGHVVEVFYYFFCLHTCMRSPLDFFFLSRSEFCVIALAQMFVFCFLLHLVCVLLVVSCVCVVSLRHFAFHRTDVCLVSVFFCVALRCVVLCFLLTLIVVGLGAASHHHRNVQSRVDENQTSGFFVGPCASG